MTSENRGIEIAKLVIEATRVLAWPFLILVLIVVFNGPLRDIARGLSVKLSEANKVSIGSLSLEIEAKAREGGYPELGRQVGNLSPSAVEELLHAPRLGDMILVGTSDFDGRRRYGLPRPQVLDALKELEVKGFLKFRTPIDAFILAVRKQLLPDSGRTDSERDWYFASSPAESPEDKSMRDQGYSLTEKGRQAVDTIIKAVATDLSRPNTKCY